MTNSKSSSTEISLSTRSSKPADTAAASKPPELAIFTGEIKSIIIPVTISTQKHKKWKRREIRFCFSMFKPKEEKYAVIKKEMNFLYKYGSYAPGIHLVSMKPVQRPPVDEMFKELYIKYAMPHGQMPATATITEQIDLYPCHNDVLPLVLQQYDYPDFFITLLPDTAILNIRTNSTNKISYQRIQLRHTEGRCNYDVGYSYIHVYDDKGIRGLSYYRQLDWPNIIFKVNEVDSQNHNLDCIHLTSRTT